MTALRVRGGAGVRLHMAVAGPEGAPAILFVHGWSQHHLAFARQLAGPLAARFRLGALDLRGHGASEHPAGAASYRDGALWAADIAAAVAALGGRPVLVGWSMGGWVVQDYLRHHGDGAVAGVVFTGSGARTGARADPEWLARRRPEARAEGMYADDQAAALEAAVGFAKACFAAPPSKRDLALMVGWQMLVEPAVRRACADRDEDWRADLAGLRIPALVIQGAAERVCPEPMAAELAAAIPAARMIVYAGAGHLPFREAAQRFDADLAAFADAAQGREAA